MPLARGMGALLPHPQSPGASAEAPGAGYALEGASPEALVISGDGLDHDIVIEGPADSVDELARELGPFEDAAVAWEGSGLRVGVVIDDLGSGASLAYGADEKFYPASSIKGPYVISVYETMVDTGIVSGDAVRRLAEPAIISSDNDAYRALRDLCGSQAFADWAVACGAVEPGSEQYAQFASHSYPRLSARQLARMWGHAFAYLSEGSDGARELVGLFERREESPIRAGVDASYLTLTKAGWYPEDDGGDSAASTCDAGIILDGSRAYVVVIMTDAPADLDLLADLVPGIYSATVVLE